MPNRWKNLSNLNQYMDCIRLEQFPVDQKENLSGESLEFEYVFLHLRLREGLNKLEYTKRFHQDFDKKYSDKLKQFLSAGLLEQEGENLRLSKQGWLLADEIVSSF